MLPCFARAYMPNSHRGAIKSLAQLLVRKFFLFSRAPNLKHSGLGEPCHVVLGAFAAMRQANLVGVRRVLFWGHKLQVVRAVIAFIAIDVIVANTFWYLSKKCSGDQSVDHVIRRRAVRSLSNRNPMVLSVFSQLDLAHASLGIANSSKGTRLEIIKSWDWFPDFFFHAPDYIGVLI